MGNSIFLAQLLGPIYLIVGLGMLLRGAHFKKVYDSFIKNEGLMYLAGLLALILGLLIISVHNRWSMEWTVILTVIGWVSLLKGAMLMIFPEYAKKTAKIWIKPQKMKAAGVIALILGLILTCFGCF